MSLSRDKGQTIKKNIHAIRVRILKRSDSIS
jgi:hypothetical protein